MTPRPQSKWIERISPMLSKCSGKEVRKWDVNSKVLKPWNDHQPYEPFELFIVCPLRLSELSRAGSSITPRLRSTTWFEQHDRITQVCDRVANFLCSHDCLLGEGRFGRPYIENGRTNKKLIIPSWKMRWIWCLKFPRTRRAPPWLSSHVLKLGAGMPCLFWSKSLLSNVRCSPRSSSF